MADLTLGIAKDIVKTGMAIKEALDTIRQNEEECEELQVLVATVIAILSRLEEVELMIHPAMCGALVSLNRSLDRALKLVTVLQNRNGLHRFFTARDMAKQLGRVHDDIQKKMQVGNFAITASMMEVTINLTKTTIFQYDAAHLLPTRPQEAVELEMYSSHSNTGLMKFSLSKTVTTHQVSEENMNGGSTYTVVSKQKIVIKMQMSCDKCRSRAMALLTRRHGVSSVGIAGEGKDQVIIEGQGFDSVDLTILLRKKVGPAQLMLVSDAEKAKKPTVEAQRAVVRDEEEQQEPATRRPRARSSGIRAITAKLSRFIWRRPRKSTSRPAPSPLLTEHEHTDTPARGSLIVSADQEHARASPLRTRAEDQAAAAAPRRTFDMSRVRRRARLPVARRQSRMMQRARAEASPSTWCGALRFLPPCASSALLLVVTVWAYASFAHP